MHDDRHKKGSYASPTAVTDGQRVYAWFGSEGLYAYDVDGKLKWKTETGALPQIGMGPGTSPVMDGDLIFLQCDIEEGEGSALVAVDKRTGKVAWRAARKAGASWATPLIVKDGARKLLVASGTEAVIAYEPATGKEAWRSKGVAGYAIPSPVADEGMVFVSAGYPEKRAYGLKTSDGSVVWSHEKGTAYVPSPILYRGRLYLTTDRGILTCLDAKTGAVIYPGGRVPKPATFTASLVAVDGKILMTSEEGETFVIKAGDVHEVLGTNAVGEAVYASPAIAGGVVYLRGAKHLFAVRGS